MGQECRSAWAQVRASHEVVVKVFDYIRTVVIWWLIGLEDPLSRLSHISRRLLLVIDKETLLDPQQLLVMSGPNFIVLIDQLNLQLRFHMSSFLLLFFLAIFLKSGHLYYFSQAAMPKYNKLSSLTNRNLLSHIMEAKKVWDQGVTRVAFIGRLFPCFVDGCCFLDSLPHLLSVCAPALISSSYRDTSHIGLRPTLMISF